MFLVRRNNRAKTKSEEESDRAPEERLPFSTRTLRFQVLVLGVLTLVLFTGLVPSTIFARTGHAHLTIQPSNPTLMSQIDTRYWDYGFCTFSRDSNKADK